MKRTAIGIIAALAIGCTRNSTGPQMVSLHGVGYEFPARDVDSFVRETPGTLYVRLRPPGRDFELILDELSHYSLNRQGASVPTISRLNDHSFSNFDVHRSPSGAVICGDNFPHFNCGLRVTDGQVRWSVLFDRDRIGRADQIRLEATAVIRSYRRGIQ